MSEQRLQLSSVEKIEQYVHALGEQFAQETVIIGSAALYLALPDTARPPHDLDMLISEGVHRHLRNQPGWEETPVENGRYLLANGSYDLEFNPDASVLDGLKARSWQTSDQVNRRISDSVNVACLPDIFRRKWVRNMGKDQADMARTRRRLLSPEHPPLPPHLMRQEIPAVRSTLPEHLQDNPEAELAIQGAASALLITSTLYGDRRIGKVNTIVGDLEDAAAATYHNGFDVLSDMRLLQHHLYNIGASDEGRLLAMLAEAGSDMVYGNGRMEDNPENYDELRSANLVVSYARHLRGPDKVRDKLLRDMVLGTRFSEVTRQQPGKYSDNPLVRAVAGVDLQGLAEPHSVPAAFGIIAENGTSKRFSPELILGRALLHGGVRISSTAEMMAFVDDNPDFRPNNVPNARTTRRYVIDGLFDSADFRDPDSEKSYQPPHDWTLDRPAMRKIYAAKLREFGAAIATGRLTLSKAYMLAQEYGAEQEAYIMHPGDRR